MPWTISSSDGLHLHFPTRDLYDEYKAMEHTIKMEMYQKIRHKHGIWAGNQGKFVSSVAELNDFDSTVMEDAFWKWLNEETG